MGTVRNELRHHFGHPVRRVWPLISNTELLNRLRGAAPVFYEEVTRPDGPPHRWGTQKLGPLTTRYEEVSFEWRYGAWYRADRRFPKGPLKGYVYEVTLEPDTPGDWDEGGCTVIAVLEQDVPDGMGFPSRLLGGAISRSFGRVWKSLESALAKGETPETIQRLSAGVEGVPSPPRRADGRARIEVDRAVGRMVGQPEALVEQLRSALVELDPLELHRMRPYFFARVWGRPRREVLELFLEATRAGVLGLRWDLLCPHCRGDRRNFTRLDQVENDGFCAACDIHFDVDLGRNLEAVFTPHPTLRESEPARYCIGGPGSNAHLYAHHVLAPGASVDSALRLPAGRYRVRVSGANQSRWLDVGAPSPGAKNTVRITDAGLEGEDLRFASEVETVLHLENASGRTVRVGVETAEWIQDILCAAELVSTQKFRSLFGTEALAPGIQLSVERMTVLFTDVVGSTAMYREIGDARAFRLVWSHFDALTDVIAEEGGAVVKTIGDAVMATFSDPRSALRAAARFQEAVNRQTEPLGIGPPLTLKIGLAEGPALAVTLNGRLDYFGSTVNLAARVQGQSKGGEILANLDGSRLAEAEQLLEALGWKARSESVDAKGFEARIPVLRFTRARAAALPESKPSPALEPAA